MILVGIISGILGSMGLGGGTVLIPLLALIGITQKSAQVINIFSFIIMAFFILYFNVKKGYTKVFEGIAFCLVGIIFSVIFSLLVKSIDDRVLKICFGIFLSIVALFEIFSFFGKYYSKK